MDEADRICGNCGYNARARCNCSYHDLWNRISELKRQVQMHKNHADRLGVEPKGGVMIGEDPKATLISDHEADKIFGKHDAGQWMADTPDASGGLCQCSLCLRDKRIAELEAQLRESERQRQEWENYASRLAAKIARLKEGKW